MAMFAMLLVALMPTISRATAAANGDAAMFQELCTSGRVKRVIDDAAANSPAHKLVQHLESCGYCIAFGHDAALPPPLRAEVAPLIAFVQEMPARFYSATPKRHAWSSVQARAPPHSIFCA
jgi:hypothetical protein